MPSEDELWLDLAGVVELLEVSNGRYPKTEERLRADYQRTITDLHDSHGVSYYKIGLYVMDVVGTTREVRANAKLD